MNTKALFIRAEWDHEAIGLGSHQRDVPGLATESDTLENLVHKLKVVIPELLEANGMDLAQETPFELLSRRFETTQGTAA